MPTLSASDYTTYLKFKAASVSPIAPAIQTRTNATLSQSLLNAYTLTSQAALVTTPANRDVLTLVPTVSAVSSQTVTAARTDILSAAVGNGTTTTYTSSQAHGLTNGATVSILGFTGVLAVNAVDGVVTVVNATQFTIPTAANGTATGTGRIVGRVYYTTSVAHGLSPGQSVSVTGITTFTASSATVLAVPTTTTFALSSSTTGTAVSTQTGTLVGFIYYTTSDAHGLSLTRSDQTLTVSGITTVAAFNTTTGSVINVPSATVFVLAGSTVNAVTSQTGTVRLTTFFNPNVSLTGLARVRPVQPSTTNNPNALSTLSGSGTMSSSAIQRPGGLPTGFRGSQNTYTRLPQNAGWA